MRCGARTANLASERKRGRRRKNARFRRSIASWRLLKSRAGFALICTYSEMMKFRRETEQSIAPTRTILRQNPVCILTRVASSVEKWKSKRLLAPMGAYRESTILCFMLAVDSKVSSVAKEINTTWKSFFT